jgi:hypothetical protein
MKFTIQSFIALFITSSALLLTQMRSDAQVNIKLLTQVAKTCQKDVPYYGYYKQMGFNINTLNDDLISRRNLNRLIRDCISSRYYYSLVLTKYPWLTSTGEILPKYPGSVAAINLGYKPYTDYRPSEIKLFLDCLVNQNTSSRECYYTRSLIGVGEKIRKVTSGFDPYLIYVCPSCVVAHDDVSGSKEEILKAFIQWFLTLDKSQRRELISLLGDDDNAKELRDSLYNESIAAVEEYQEARARVEQQEREQRRQELLGQ